MATILWNQGCVWDSRMMCLVLLMRSMDAAPVTSKGVPFHLSAMGLAPPLSQEAVSGGSTISYHPQ